jgi:PEP-CTERM motif
MKNAGLVIFKLSIHEDIPATGTEHSHPRNELWSRVFQPREFKTRLYGVGSEGFYDPNVNQVIGLDSQIWQYNFTGIKDAFLQEKGTIYWLDVQVNNFYDANAFFAWKTTKPQETPHFNDDAVFADTAGFNGVLLTPWSELRCPTNYPFEHQSIDLAFVITTVPEPSSFALVGVGALSLIALRRNRSPR